MPEATAITGSLSTSWEIGHMNSVLVLASIEKEAGTSVQLVLERALASSSVLRVLRRPLGFGAASSTPLITKACSCDEGEKCEVT
jgi:hypothetical protein